MGIESELDEAYAGEGVKRPSDLYDLYDRAAVIKARDRLWNVDRAAAIKLGDLVGEPFPENSSSVTPVANSSEIWQEVHDAHFLLLLLPESDETRRRLRLFGCWCLRQIWDLLDDECRHVVEVAEQVVRGEAGIRDMRKATEAAGGPRAWQQTWRGGGRRGTLAKHAAVAATIALGSFNPWRAADGAATLSAVAAARFSAGLQHEALRDYPPGPKLTPAEESIYEQTLSNARRAQADRLREMWPNPFL